MGGRGWKGVAVGVNAAEAPCKKLFTLNKPAWGDNICPGKMQAAPIRTNIRIIATMACFISHLYTGR